MAQPKKAGFAYVNGIRMNNIEDKGVDLAMCLTDRSAGSSASWGTTSRGIGSVSARDARESYHATAPIYLTQSNKVLRFFGMYKEAVNESNEETYRVRKVLVNYYLADNTWEIQEPKQANSGIPQGMFLKRGIWDTDEVPSHVQDFWRVFRVNGAFAVHSRRFIIYGADDFTKQYCESRGYALEEPNPDVVALTQDSYTDARLEISRKCGGDTSRNFGKKNSALKSFMEASLGNAMQRGSNTRSERKAQFLVNEGKVLRFFCEFNDTDSLYGDVMKYTLNYFLADDTVEIKEERRANSGRDPFPLLLKRQKLPHNWMAEGVNDRDRGVEEDCEGQVYVTPDEVQVGDFLTVYGRLLKIVDCDDFTRSWYKANPHMHPSGEQGAFCGYVPAVRQLPKQKPAPYSGYGTYEDSLGSCTHLIPKVPKKDFHKFMKNSSNVLRFKARYARSASLRNEHQARMFIISYFMADDTLSVFESTQRNSGIMAGKFLERGPHLKPDGGKFAISDLFVGATITLNSSSFEIIGQDEFTTNKLSAR